VFEATVVPHPIQPIDFSVFDGETTVGRRMLNDGLPGTTHEDKYQSWIEDAQLWRMAYMSVTVRQDAAAISNEGMLSCCQYPVVPTMGNLCVSGQHSSLEPTQVFVGPHVGIYSLEDNPDFDKAQLFPNAYIGKMKDGAYMPMKLDQLEGVWHGEHDQIAVLGLSAGYDSVLGGSEIQVSAPEGLSWPLGVAPPWCDPSAIVPSLDGDRRPSSAAKVITPFREKQGSEHVGAGPTYGWEVTSNQCSNTFGQISAKNLDPRCNVIFTVYMGL